MDVLDDNLVEEKVITHKLKVIFSATVVLYILYLAVTLISLPAQMEMADKINEAVRGGEPNPGEILKIMSEGFGYGGILLLLQISAIVCYCIWFYRALENTRLIGYTLPYSSGWSVGAIFVPVVNLIVPFKSFKSLLKGSSEFNDGTSRKEPLSFILWWALQVLIFVALIYFVYAGVKLQMQIQMLAQQGDLDNSLRIFNEMVENQRMQMYVGLASLATFPLFIHCMYLVTKRQGEI